MAFMMRDPRLVSWWTENSAKCARDGSVVHVPAWAALVATEFGLPYQELCVYLVAVLNDFGA